MNNKLHRVTVVAAALCGIGLAAETAVKLFAPGMPHGMLHVAIVVTAVASVASYCATAAAERVAERVVAESVALHRAIVAEMLQYGDQRAIDSWVSAERRRRAGESTVEISTGAHATVTPLRRHG